MKQTIDKTQRLKVGKKPAEPRSAMQGMRLWTVPVTRRAKETIYLRCHAANPDDATDAIKDVLASVDQERLFNGCMIETRKVSKPVILSPRHGADMLPSDRPDFKMIGGKA